MQQMQVPAWERLHAGQAVQVFLRPPYGSLCDFSVSQVAAAHARVAPAAAGRSGTRLGQVAGWLPATVMEDFERCGGSESVAEGLRVERYAFKGSRDRSELRSAEQEPPATPLGIDVNPAELGTSVPGALGAPGNLVCKWSGVALLEPGSKVRLVAGAGYRLSLGRTRDAKPRAAVPSDGSGEELIEVRLEGGRHKGPPAALELLPPAAAEAPVRSNPWQPLPVARLRTPDRWVLVRFDDEDWLDMYGRPCGRPSCLRVSPLDIRLDAAPPLDMALLIVQAASPAQNGVGGMTPNRQFAAALEEMAPAYASRKYAVHTALIWKESELDTLSSDNVAPLFAGVGRVGAVYLLSPQQIQGAFRTKSYLVHDRALFGLMERLERAGLPTVFPHPSHLYRALVSKEWPAQLCLVPAFHVPLSTRVPRGAVARDPEGVAAEALAALDALRAAQPGAKPPDGLGLEHRRCVVKTPCAWKSEGVVMCTGAGELAAALRDMAAHGEHTAYLVQERRDGVICEAMVYLLRGQLAGIRYYTFARHRAPPEYVTRSAAASLLGGEQALREAEDTMKDLALRWLAWTRAQCCSPVPFLRLDFLVAASKAAGGALEIWTCEVSELGVAATFEGLSDEASRDLVFKAVFDEFFGLPLTA